MKELVENALSAIRGAQSIGGVRRAAKIAYPHNEAPGSPDQAVLQMEVAIRKAVLRASSDDYDRGNHTIGCPALTGGICQCG